ncbi:MAG: response regulator [Bacteroidales bacterium]|nr:response regulator [Bacteroidales bacterium]
MNQIEQNSPSDLNKKSSSNDIISQNTPNILSFFNYPQNTDSNSLLFEFLKMSDSPVLIYLFDGNTIIFNHAFEDLCSKLTNENNVNPIHHTILKLWETENMPAVFNDMLNSNSGGILKKTNRSAKFTKQLKVNYDLFVCEISKSEYLAWLVFEKIFDETDKADDKIESATQTIEVFFNNLSHEIRTPLNAILGFAELLNIKDLSDDQKVNYLNIIKNKGRLLINYLEDVMELTKLENQSIQLAVTEVSLPQLFNDIHKEYIKELKEKEKTLELFLKIAPADEISTCYVDKGRLYQVIKNMLDTAVILTEKGYIQWGYEIKDQRWINYYVKYTGKALTAQQQKILLEPLRIKEDVIDPFIQKIGLKLALVKLIARNMEGKFSIEQGELTNTFNVALPFKRKERSTSTASSTQLQKPNWKNKVILIAEDDDVNYQFLEALLADTHAQVIHVQNGKQAIELCHSLPKIDLILMDIKMPEKNGFDAIREIRQTKGKEIAIVAQTAYSSKDDKEKCFRMGCDAYLVKPLDIEIFFKVLSKFLND